MERITTENIEKEIEALLDTKGMSKENLEMFVLLCRSMKYLGRVKREFTQEDAEEWVKHMNPPAKWTMEQTTAVMHQHNYHHRPCEFWAVMNSLYSDYGYTMRRHNADSADIFAELANDWITDGDAVCHKVGKYYREIVKHD